MSRIYFASDMHLGFPSWEKSLEREKLLVRWMDSIIDDADALYLLGDVFDFWFEYKHVVPRGFTRFLGKLAEFHDKGIPVHFFTGNHDVWVFDYLPRETGIKVYRKPEIHNIDGKIFFIGHGDGLGSKDWSFHLLKKIFTNPVLQWLFARIHPNSAIGFGHRWSKHSRYSKGFSINDFTPEKEDLVNFIKEQEQQRHCDFYIFGHRHIPIDFALEKTRYINLGDWLSHYSFALWDGNQIYLKRFENV